MQSKKKIIEAVIKGKQQELLTTLAKDVRTLFKKGELELKYEITR